MKAKIFMAVSKVLKIAPVIWHVLGTQSIFICEQPVHEECPSLYLVYTGIVQLYAQGEAMQKGDPAVLWAE